MDRLVSAAITFVIDDDPATRDSLRWLIESIGLTVETHDTAAQFLAKYSGQRPGCLVVDVRMHGMSGLELQEELARRDIVLPVIVITGHADVPMAVRALKAGAIDFLEKPLNDQALLDRIQGAIELDWQRCRAEAELEEMCSRLSVLTHREKQIVDLLVDGKSNKEIAADLRLSTRTVEGHRAHIMDKLGAGSVAEVVRLGLLNRTTARQP